jgi:predicted short-subunit dehydrogenase-like oxidoreductase (DUF2520 family)
MQNQQSLGLVVEGNSTSSAILRLPSIAEELGPIKSGALRVARRVSNFLRGGYPVQNYADLQAARLILLRVPDAAVPRVVDELCSSDLVLKDLAFALCDTYMDASVLRPLQARGASVASVLSVHSFRRSWFVIEGQLGAVRQLRRFLDRGDARAFELRPGTKPLYFAAQMLTTVLPLNLFATAQKALRTAGISGNELNDLLQELSFEMFRAFSNGARVPSAAFQTGPLRAVGGAYLAILRTDYPQIAFMLEQQFRCALGTERVEE